jgi:hypothetical protein
MRYTLFQGANLIKRIIPNIVKLLSLHEQARDGMLGGVICWAERHVPVALMSGVVSDDAPAAAGL